MAKKHSRKVSKNIESSPVTAVSSSRNRLTSSDFNPDYSDIISDLKRIGILAGSFIGILVIISFFLR